MEDMYLEPEERVQEEKYCEYCYKRIGIHKKAYKYEDMVLCEKCAIEFILPNYEMDWIDKAC